MDPLFLTGLVDGEGCFTLSILINNKLKTGLRVQLFFFSNYFTIKDKALLELIQSYFGN